MTYTTSLKTANQLLKAGKLNDARQEYQRLIQQRPYFAWNYYYLGQLFVQEEKWSDAINQYRQGIRLNPSSANLHNSLAEALIKQGKLDEAINSSQKAISLQPHWTICHQTLALAYEAKSDLGQALTTWQKVLSLNPSHLRAAQKIFWLQTDVARDYVETGEKLNKEGKIKEAVESYQQALILNPQQPIPIYRTCGNNLITLGKFKEAENVFEQLKKVAPEVPDGYEGYARLTQSLGDWKLALKQWEDAIVKFPEHLGFKVNKVNVLIKLSRFDEAEVVFQQLKEKYPSDPQDYESYAMLARNLRDWEFALECLEDAIAKFPNHFNFYLQKGDLLAHLYRYEEAEIWWEKVISQYPRRHEGLSQSAVLARRLGNREFTCQRFEQIIEKFPSYILAYFNAALELIAMGRFAEAEEKFREALQREPNNLTILLHGGIFASQQGNRELALERFEQAIKFYDPQKAVDAYILAAAELKYMGRQSEAIAKYEQILSFHQQRGLYPKLKLLGTFLLVTIPELGLLLDRLVTKQLGSAEDVVALAQLIDKILFWPKNYAAPVDKDAPSLLPKLKKLKKLFEQVITAQEDCLVEDLDEYLLVLKYFNMAIQLLEKESQRLNSREWGRIKLIRTAIPLPLIDKLSFEKLEKLSSSARYFIGTDEQMPKSQREATVKYLPGLMDQEKKYFAASLWKLGSRFRLRKRQSIEIFKDFICEPPFGFSGDYILPLVYYHNGISQEFIDELGRDHPDDYGKNISYAELKKTNSKIDPLRNINFYDPRSFLEEIAVSQKALDSYYKDEVVFGIPNIWTTWGAYENYGHLLFDQIPSLILYQKLNLSCPIFVPHITDSHWEIFGHLNIPKEKILVKQEQKFKYFMIGRYQHDVGTIDFYQKLRESIVVKRGDIPSKYCARYVYISRKYAARRKMANEEEVEQLMASLGFSIVYGERLSFEEKAMLMHHTSVLVSPWGSGIQVCAIMCNPNTRIISIFPPNFNVMPNSYDCFIWVLGEHHAYNLLGEQAPDGWKMNINKLRKVITTILENS
jgi:superkiller protein 3